MCPWSIDCAVTDSDIVLDVDEDDPRLMRREGAHDVGADAGGTARDEHDAAGKLVHDRWE